MREGEFQRVTLKHLVSNSMCVSVHLYSCMESPIAKWTTICTDISICNREPIIYRLVNLRFPKYNPFRMFTIVNILFKMVMMMVIKVVMHVIKKFIVIKFLRDRWKIFKRVCLNVWQSCYQRKQKKKVFFSSNFFFFNNDFIWWINFFLLP